MLIIESSKTIVRYDNLFVFQATVVQLLLCLCVPCTNIIFAMNALLNIFYHCAEGTVRCAASRLMSETGHCSVQSWNRTHKHNPIHFQHPPECFVGISNIEEFSEKLASLGDYRGGMGACL